MTGTEVSQSRYVRIIDASPGVAHGLGRRAARLALDRRRHAGLVDLRAVLSAADLRLAELLADRVHLLAQEPLTLLLGRGLDVVAMRRRTQLGEPLTLKRGASSSLDDLHRLEQLDALGEVDVGAYAQV
jgi:hypothetical protein